MLLSAPFRKTNSKCHVKDLIHDGEEAAAHVQEREASALHGVVAVLIRVIALEGAQHEPEERRTGARRQHTVR